MNCKVTILQTFDLETRGEYVCKVRKGDVYTGTANNGRVLFHVTDGGGTIHPVSLEAKDPNVKIEMFKDQTSV